MRCRPRRTRSSTTTPLDCRPAVGFPQGGTLANDLRNWVPVRPVLMCGGANDPTVNFLSTRATAGYFRAKGMPAAALTVVDLEDTAAIDAYSAARAGFAQAKSTAGAEHPGQRRRQGAGGHAGVPRHAGAPVLPGVGPRVLPGRAGRRRLTGRQPLGVRPHCARWRRSRTPSHSGVSGGVSIQISLTPCASNSRSTANSCCALASASSGMRRCSTRCERLRTAARDHTAMCAAPAPSTSRPVWMRLGVHQAHLGVGRVVRLQRAGGARVGRFEHLAVAQRSPQAASICARVITPGRSSTGAPRLQSTMVDSMPTSQAPPSITSRPSPNSSPHVLRGGRADAAEAVGAGARQAGTPCSAQASSSACATGARGSAGRWCPARRPPRRHAGLARDDQRERAGPEGLHQFLREGRQRLREARQRLGALDAGRTWTISGWSEGRPLALKMPATAMSLVASAPRP
jgi:hypothetical protein